MTKQRVYHEIKPVYDAASRVLLLGTMPSPKSREFGFYYSHPQNRLWRVLAALFREAAPESKEAREQFLLGHGIAMWDVLCACDIKGADDGSIAGAEPNDLNLILGAADIRAVFTTGKKAANLYRRLCLPATGVASVYLPSTSPANCALSFEALVDAYRVLLEYVIS
jgi:hypoxanthine-DNA glycosylase